MEIKDPKTRLQEMIQQYINETPTYTVVHEEGKDHEKIFTINALIQGIVIGTGTGTNKKSAQESAAEDALAHGEAWTDLIQSKKL